ncbi:MAG: NAD(P)-binding domain-containing protein [Silicimonas sp.]|nr:NAD(P)-binding domain-containing protein [Silicimonas sp.]
MPSNRSEIATAKAKGHPADLIETGNALRTQAGAFATSCAETPTAATTRYPVAVIGAGQAGLSVSYHLKRLGIRHIVLDGATRIGEVWRNRWDSLRLFTAAKFDGLDGYPFPEDRDAFPTKDQMADYLESYAEKFELPVQLNSSVRKLTKSGGRYRVETLDSVFEADQVVIAAASYQKPRIPEFASELDASIFQLHSKDYRNPSLIPGGPVLLVGAGNSGAEIAMDLAKTHEVVLAGRDVGRVPFDISGFLGRKILVRTVIRGMFHHVLTMRTPMGRKFRAKMLDHGMPLIRTRPGQLEYAGVRRIGRIAEIRNGRAIDVDGQQATFSSVIWCTGYHPGFDWIDLPILDADGHPRHRFGKAIDAEGLYFMGLHFQYAVSSTMVAGVGRDARRVAGWIKSETHT